MVAIKIDKFGAMVPKLSDHQLPDSMAALAEDTWLEAGVLESMRQPQLVYTCTQPTTLSVFRVPLMDDTLDVLTASHWMEFASPDVNVIRNPTSDDTHKRFYWCGEVGQPAKYNTKTDILAGNPALHLGIPAPSSAPTLTLPPSGTDVTRAYVVTYVSAYGEEGPPSIPVVGTADTAAPWTVNLPSPDPSESANRNLTHKRIYRTITSNTGVAMYHRLTEVSIVTASYSDSVTDSVLVTAPTLESSFWTAPPLGLEGWAEMPNGMVVAFKGQELWFCEPYRLHAWPASYQLNTSYNIVGIGVVGQTCVVCTEVFTYAVSGVNPGAMTLSIVSRTEPCLSRGSIVSTAAGVLYTSPNGLIAVTPGGADNVTSAILGKRRWGDLHNLRRLRAAKLGSSYYCFGRWGGLSFQADTFQADTFQPFDAGTSLHGAMMSFSEKPMPYTRLTTSEMTNNVLNDVWTDEVLVVRQDENSTVRVYHIDVSDNRPPATYTWRTKRFSTKKKLNFAVAKISYDEPANELNPAGTFRMYADGRKVFERPIPASGKTFRLPSGYKAGEWQFEIEGNLVVDDMHIAESERELAND